MRRVPSLFMVLITTIVVFTAYCGSGAEKKVEKKGEEGKAMVTVDSVKVGAGDSADVAIRMENTEAIGGMQFRIGFDATKVTLDKPKTTKRSSEMLVMHNIKDNELLIMMYNLSGKSISAGRGTVLRLPVKVSEKASGSSILDLREVILATHNAQTVPSAWKSGLVTIGRR